MEETKSKLRRPVLAGLLSLLVPGLGQLYNGELNKGFILYVVVTIIQTFLIVLPNTLPPTKIIISLVIALLIMTEAILSARKTRETHLKYYNVWYIYTAITIMYLFSGYTPTTLKFALSAILATAFSSLKIAEAQKKTTSYWYLYLLLALFFEFFSVIPSQTIYVLISYVSLP